MREREREKEQEGERARGEGEWESGREGERESGREGGRGEGRREEERELYKSQSDDLNIYSVTVLCLKTVCLVVRCKAFWPRDVEMLFTLLKLKKFIPSATCQANFMNWCDVRWVFGLKSGSL